MNLRVLFVEDDKNLAISIVHYLELNSIVCDYCSDGNLALNLLKTNKYDVIISDVNMPEMDGYTFCSKVREQGYDVPLMMLTALTEIDDKLTGFDSGADDYLTKPFEMKELLARIFSLAKRRSGNMKLLKIKELGLELNLDNHIAFRDNIKLNLPPSCWIILETLARAYPKPVKKSDIEFAIWGDELPDSNSLKVHIHGLRKNLDKPFESPILHIITGFGFELRPA
ncbi:response regulator transcription factor [Psychrosphaera sp. B3R10]|uniref:response regulator transcription factor n=1 Tax=unclassified Psychrosphaera TaxID=2641570 RepID=UPI001C095002|nr:MULTISPECIES: response regulator transcription factor [unclassified Psychrosphaera]MBU2883603.1 response regulator transcription factor [Psychrosphaera sp. I2R16]MBU2989781.1 response regulator transcription factor [Psychrosphaera sp. B3R10]